MNQRGLHLLVFSLLCSSALGQTGPPFGGYSPVPPKAIVWPPGVAPGDFQDAYFGSFTGGGSPDAVVLKGTKVHVVFDVQFQATLIPATPSGEDVVAIAALRPESGDDNWPVAMLTDDGDLFEYVYPGPATLIATGAPWDAVVGLRPADLDGLGPDDLIGATASGLYTLENDGTGWVAGSTVSFPGALLDLVPLNWDLDSELECAVLSTAGLYVYDLGGTLLDYFVGSGPAGMIARIPAMDGYPRERIAWVFPAGGNHYLFECSSGGARVTSGTFAAAPSAISAGTFRDETGFRRVDLMTTAQNDSFARYYLHTASGLPYTPGTAGGSMLVGAGTPFGDARIPFRDASGDGVPDALVCRPANGAAYYLGGAELTFAGSAYPKAELTPFVDPAVRQDGSTVWFETHLVLPAFEANYTHVQIRMWRSYDGEVLEEAEYRNLAFETDDPQYAPDEDHEESADMRIAIDMPSPWLDVCELADEGNELGLYFTMRMVTLGATGRPATFSASVDAGVTFTQAIADEMAPNNEPELPVVNPDCPPPGPPTTAPALIKNPVWALTEPTATPTFIDPPVENPTIIAATSSS